MSTEQVCASESRSVTEMPDDGATPLCETRELFRQRYLRPTSEMT